MTDDEWHAALEAICERIERYLRQSARDIPPAARKLLSDTLNVLRS